MYKTLLNVIILVKLYYNFVYYTKIITFNTLFIFLISFLNQTEIIYFGLVLVQCGFKKDMGLVWRCV